MRPAGRSRRFGILAVSLAFHVALLAAVAVQAPRLRFPVESSGPPQAIIPILIMPRAPPPADATAPRPAAIRLHRRPQRFAPAETPVAPLVVPQVEAPRAAPAPGPRTIQLPPAEDAVAASARKALRGKLGCSSANLLNLSPAERQACEDALAAGGRDAPFLGLGVNRDKASELGRAAARREADYNYKRNIKPAAPASGGLPWDTTRGPEGQAAALGAALGNDRPAAKVPF